MARARTRIRRRLRRQAPRVRRAAGAGARAARQDARAQAKSEGALMIGGARDPAEKAADRMAAQVLAGGSAGPGATAAPGAVHRKCAACAGGGATCPACAENDEKGQNRIGRSAKAGAVTAPGAGAAPASPGAAKAIGAMGPGRPLGRAERAFFEPRFARDFSGVRVHDGLAADRAAQAIDARAFTHGRDIAFARGARDRGGKALMAHELAHVAAEGGTARRAIRRLGDLSKVPSGMSCPVPSGPAKVHPVTKVDFMLGGAALSKTAKAELSSVAARYHSFGGGFTLRIDGFASTDGSDAVNWPLSCRRAEAVRDELAKPSDGSTGVPGANLQIFAQGETAEFGKALTANRVATVRSNLPFEQRVCEKCPVPQAPKLDVKVLPVDVTFADPKKFGNTQWSSAKVTSVSLLQTRKKTCDTCPDGTGGTAERYEFCPVEFTLRAKVNIRINKDKITKAKPGTNRFAYRDCTGPKLSNRFLTHKDAKKDPKWKRKTIAGVRVHELYHMQVGERLWIEELKKRTDTGSACPYTIEEHVKWLDALEKSLKADSEAFLQANPNEPSEELNARKAECATY